MTDTNTYCHQLSDTIGHFMWFRNFQIDQGYSSIQPAMLDEDNMSTIQLVKNGQPHSDATRHITVWQSEKERKITRRNEGKACFDMIVSPLLVKSIVILSPASLDLILSLSISSHSISSNFISSHLISSYLLTPLTSSLVISPDSEEGRRDKLNDISDPPLAWWALSRVKLLLLVCKFVCLSVLLCVAVDISGAGMKWKGSGWDW